MRRAAPTRGGIVPIRGAVVPIRGRTSPIRIGETLLILAGGDADFCRRRY
jgi:hypothetical protein